jgi:antitoxin FitA
MGQILVRNLDDAVIATLKQRAAQRKTSLEQTARDILAAAARPTKEEAWAMLDRIAKLGKPSPVSSVEMIRAFRDGDDADC